MLDKDSHWGYDNGIKTLVTTLLQMTISGNNLRNSLCCCLLKLKLHLGYPFVLPDMIGGNGYGDVRGGYRGHQRPILIIQPPTQPPADPLLQGLTSLIPLAYLLPLALLAASSANPTTTVVGRKKRSAYLGKV